MTEIAIRQSGGANIVSIPKAILKTMNLEPGSKLELSIENNRIVLTPCVKELTLEDLLAGCKREDFELTEEDKQWLNDTPKGDEIW